MHDWLTPKQFAKRLQVCAKLVWQAPHEDRITGVVWHRYSTDGESCDVRAIPDQPKAANSALANARRGKTVAGLSGRFYLRSPSGTEMVLVSRDDAYDELRERGAGWELCCDGLTLAVQQPATRPWWLLRGIVAWHDRRNEPRRAELDWCAMLDEVLA